MHHSEVTHAANSEPGHVNLTSGRRETSHNALKTSNCFHFLFTCAKIRSLLVPNVTHEKIARAINSRQYLYSHCADVECNQ